MEDFETTSTAELIDLFVSHKKVVENSRDKLARIEYEIISRLRQDGATEVVAGGHTATLTTSIRYDQARLRAVMEFVSEEELVQRGAYIPAHEETVPAAWNATKLKPFARRGREIREVIDAAKMEGVPRLSVQKVRDDRGGV